MRLIDADELLLSMMLIAPGETKKYCYPCREILKEIDDAPTIDPQRTGKWLKVPCKFVTSKSYVYQCNKCEAASHFASEFCSHCGAKME